MKIDDYYRNIARVNLNGSLLALLPAILLVGGNLVLFQNKQIMVLVIPFLLYSIINFQFYIKKIRQAQVIGKNLPETINFNSSISTSQQFLLFFYNTLSPNLIIFFPDGLLAGKIKKYRQKGQKFGVSAKVFALYDSNNELICCYQVHGKKQRKIEVFDREKVYLGCFTKSKQSFSKKYKKELLNREGRFVAGVEGSRFYMDEQIVDSYNMQIGRLQRGWMPLEWGKYFLDPNTPVLTFSKGISEKDKLLQLSFLIDEFFLER